MTPAGTKGGGFASNTRPREGAAAGYEKLESPLGQRCRAVEVNWTFVDIENVGKWKKE